MVYSRKTIEFNSNIFNNNAIMIVPFQIQVIKVASYMYFFKCKIQISIKGNQMFLTKAPVADVMVAMVK